MSESHDEADGGTRRKFLLGAGAAAGGGVLLGAGAPARAQEPKATPQEPKAAPQEPAQPPLRASAPAATNLQKLGVLADLGGRWVGRGFNQVSLPAFHLQKTFRVQLNATIETLEFTQIGGPVPNRGSKGQDDINLFGYTYFQRVSDATDNGALHIEPGIWLHVPPTDVPPQANSTIVRQATIPHGDSLLAIGEAKPPIDKAPEIPDADTTPFHNPPGPPLGAGYLVEFDKAELPAGMKREFAKNPNLLLKEAIADQKIIKTVEVKVSTVRANEPDKQGILNIPFVEKNANATKMEATFWIENVMRADGSVYLQLQYSQLVILNFAGIDWPHISVATLIKQ
jgi:hypothetical protein